MKKLLLISLICLLIFGFTITGLAKVNLVFWSYPYWVESEKESGWFERRIISEFQEIYPEVEIELQMLPWEGGPNKVAMAVATGTTPDILCDCEMRQMTYVAAGAMVDFEDTMDAEEKADFFPSVLEQVKFEGKVYMYLLNAGGGGMGVNRLIAEKAGAMHLLPLDRENRDWTVEEFKTFCLKIAEAKLPDTYAFAFHFADSNCMQVYIGYIHQSFGAVPFVVEDGEYRCVLNSPEAVEGLEWYLDLYSIPGVFIPGAETLGCDYYEKYYLTGKLATHTGEGAGHVMTERRDVPDKVDTIFTMWPHKGGVKNVQIVGMFGLGVFKSTPEKEKYAKLFCEFFATRPYLWEITKTTCPPRKGSYDPDSPYCQTSPYPPDDIEINWALKWGVVGAVDSGTRCPVYQQYRNIYAATMQGVFIGELTAQEGLDIVVERVNKLLDDYYAENPVK